MKKIAKAMMKKSYRPSLLATSIAAVCTAMVASSVSQASDIDIYQEAKSGEITLMMLFDISGSMGAPQLTGDKDACDIPSGTSVSSSSYEQSTNGSPKYTRYYCMVNKDAYFYKRTGTSNNYKYYKCGSTGSANQNDCTVLISKLPADASEMTTSGTNPMYYYKPKNSSRYYDRITRLKDSMFDLLYGNTSKGIAKIDDDKVIGLSAYSFNGVGRNGFILVPARHLNNDVTVNGVTKKQREVLLDAVATKLYARGGTPTGNAYAEAAAYMMGTKTFNDDEVNNFTSGDGAPVFFTYLSGGTTYYIQCSTWNTSGGCTSWPNDNNSQPRSFNFFPLDLSQYTTKTCTQTAGGSSRSGTCYYYKGRVVRSGNYPHGFNYTTATKTIDGSRYQKPVSLEQNEEIKKCSGQGIYVLTDGAPSNQHNQAKAMKNALNGATFSCTEQGGNDNDPATNCVLGFNQKLLNDNPSGLKIKTAVVGFGGAFNSITSYDKGRSQQENLDAIGSVNTPTKAAAEWGILGEGGWYSGNSSQDVVDSVNAFLGELGAEIPSVTTGSPTIPRDALNPAVLQDDAYYQQFQPTPDKKYQLWIGNIKKYAVAASGRLQGKSNANVTDSRGRLITPTYDDNGKLTSAVYDFWSTSVDANATIADGDENTLGSRKFAARGGAWSQLKLRTEGSNVQRKLLTNRVYKSGSGANSVFGDGTSLRTVNLNYLIDSNYKDDPDRGYLMSLLGYSVDAANPATINTTSLATAGELRQMGAVMHSLPVLVTNKGQVTYDADTKTIGSTDREDYVLFGTTQGLLHVVDAKTGVEKFAFVPNEMVKNQKQAFINYTSTNGGINNLYYGIDGPWSQHTEYVIDGFGNLTVGTGKGIGQQGKQLAFGGLRMGGRSYYALDLQNINDPKLHFHINPDAAASGALSHMGQSWSKPTIGYVNWGGTRKLVMFVGGGYDAGYEDPEYDQENKKGAGVYMFSADGTDKGNLLWWSSANANTTTGTTTTLPIGRKSDDMKYSVVSEIRTVDRDGDDLIDHLYFGDLGGQVFRVDLDNKAASLATFSKDPVRLLNLNITGGKSPRFYEMPAFSLYSEKGSTFAVVSVGSGNRSTPLQSYTTGTSGIKNDAVYNIYDKDVARRDLYTATSWNTKDITTLVAITNTNFIEATIKDTDGKYVNDNLAAPYATSSGWYYQFNNCVTGSDGTKTGCSDYKMQSEKVFGTPLAMNYRLYVPTFDSSKPGISGDCGAGVKGESFLTTLCLPYGQCATAEEAGNPGGNPDDRGKPLGIGIHNITVGNDVKDDGDDDDDTTSGGKVASSSNYCAATGGRMAITITGSVGSGEQTQICLIPQRWYEKLQ